MVKLPLGLTPHNCLKYRIKSRIICDSVKVKMFGSEVRAPTSSPGSPGVLSPPSPLLPRTAQASASQAPEAQIPTVPEHSPKAGLEPPTAACPGLQALPRLCSGGAQAPLTWHAGRLRPGAHAPPRPCGSRGRCAPRPRRGPCRAGGTCSELSSSLPQGSLGVMGLGEILPEGAVEAWWRAFLHPREGAPQVSSFGEGTAFFA